MNNKDSDLIFEAYKDSVLLNQEKFFGSIAKRFSSDVDEVLGAGKSKSVPSQSPQQGSGQESKRGRETQTVMIYGEPRKVDKDSLHWGSETIETIGDDPENNVQFKVYEMPDRDPSRPYLDDLKVYIPLVVINMDRYPSPPSIISEIGIGVATKAEAIQQLQKFKAKYQ